MQPIMKGYEKGISPPPSNGKAPALTTEYAHRTNTYGLIHVLIYEDMQNFEIIPILRIKEATKAGFVEIHPGECFDAENPNS